MSPPLSADRPRGPKYWGKVWGVSRQTARAILRFLHQTYGAKVAWKVGPGPRKVLVATPASIQAVRVLRVRAVRGESGGFIVVHPQVAPAASHSATGQNSPAGARVRAPGRDGDEYVTAELFQEAFGRLERRLFELERGRR